eukprot:TRINITY_DN25618_c0_g1_i2.p1 TRINITY_DN25618_c0_g1~~TRINITY_DN25618_c0_g1_i2.p1  ORF type:complete len:501 (+),score=23.96 TRINITY_DN25618_c0_g1_i2:87-1589(+)
MPALVRAHSYHVGMSLPSTSVLVGPPVITRPLSFDRVLRPCCLEQRSRNASADGRSSFSPKHRASCSATPRTRTAAAPSAANSAGRRPLSASPSLHSLERLCQDAAAFEVADVLKAASQLRRSSRDENSVVHKVATALLQTGSQTKALRDQQLPETLQELPCLARLLSVRRLQQRVGTGRHMASSYSQQRSLIARAVFHAWSGAAKRRRGPLRAAIAVVGKLTRMRWKLTLHRMFLAWFRAMCKSVSEQIVAEVCDEGSPRRLDGKCGKPRKPILAAPRSGLTDGTERKCGTPRDTITPSNMIQKECYPSPVRRSQTTGGPQEMERHEAVPGGSLSVSPSSRRTLSPARTSGTPTAGGTPASMSEYPSSGTWSWKSISCTPSSHISPRRLLSSPSPHRAASSPRLLAALAAPVRYVHSSVSCRSLSPLQNWSGVIAVGQPIGAAPPTVSPVPAGRAATLVHVPSTPSELRHAVTARPRQLSVERVPLERGIRVRPRLHVS